MKSPAEIAAKYESVGKGKTEGKFLQTFMLAILAGSFIALGGLGSQIASSCAADPSSARTFYRKLSDHNPRFVKESYC